MVFNIIIAFVTGVYKETIPERLLVICSCGQESTVNLPTNETKKIPYKLGIGCSNCKSERRFKVDHISLNKRGYKRLKSIR